MSIPIPALKLVEGQRLHHKSSMYKLLRVRYLLASLLLLYITLTTKYLIPTIHGQNCQTRVTNGLVSAPDLKGNLINSTCPQVTGLSQAAIAPYRLPSYTDLKSIFYTQPSNQGNTNYHLIDTSSGGTIATINQNDGTYSAGNSVATWLSSGSDQNGSVIDVNANLNIDNTITLNHPGLIFVEGDLLIKGNSSHGPFDATHPMYTVTGAVGLVFIVKGSINIDKSTTRVDAVLISGGKTPQDDDKDPTKNNKGYTICTAYDISRLTGDPCPNSGFTDADSNTPLIVYGNLISLNSNPAPANTTTQIKFTRSLFDNTLAAAEQIFPQPKYLAIMKNIFTQPFSVQSEGNFIPNANINVSATPPPPLP